eukprot:PLAT3341.6.p1 GENE.PLAT3341.6~~PLAT3341.6.p1  ORF type:complete len:493 (-),score=190.29 PLAT3341.6:75-1553(-)
MVSAIIWAAVGIVVIFAYRQFKKEFGNFYWKHPGKYGLYMPPTTAILGHLPLLSIETFSSSLYELFRGKFDGLGSLYFMGYYTLVIGDPAAAKEVLVRRAHDKDALTYWPMEYALGEHNLLTRPSSSAAWLHMRKTMQPAFQPGYLRRLFSVIKGNAHVLKARLHNKQGTVCLVDKEMSSFTLAVIGSACLNDSLGYSVDSDGQDHFHKSSATLLEITQELFFNPWALTFNPWKKARFKQADAAQRRFFAAAITKARAQLKDEDDCKTILDMLLMARNPDTGEGLTDAMVEDNIGLAIAAGTDTTAHTLSFTLYRLARHPEVQQRVVDEIMAQLDGRDELPYDELTELKYLTMVVMETLRLHPIAIGSTRRVPKGTKLREDVVLEEETVCFVVHRFLHMNPDEWPEPDKFDPERFSAEQSSKRHRFSYQPFSAGPQDCIGRALAWVELRYVLSLLLPVLKFDLVPGYTYSERETVTVRPAEDMPMRVSLREL